MRSYGYGFGIPSLKHTRQDGVVWEADFTKLAAGVWVPMSGLLHTRASAATVQTGSTPGTTVIQALTTDQAGIGRLLTSDVLGLVLEEARTNLSLRSQAFHAAAWVAIGAFGGADNAVLAPDGTITASTGIDADAGAFIGCSQSMVIPNDSATYSCSLFSKGDGTADAGCNSNMTGGTLVPVSARWDPVGTYVNGGTTRRDCGDYRRFIWQITNNSTGNTVLAQNLFAAVCALGTFSGDTVTATGTQTWWGHQAELGNFATEYIPTAAAAATRAAARLYHPSASTLIHSGRLSLALRFRPKGSNTGWPTFNPILWYVDGSNYMLIDGSTNRFYGKVAGVDVFPTNALSWAAEDTLDFFIEVGGGVLPTAGAYRVNGGAKIAFTGITGSPHGTVPSGGAINLLSDDTGHVLTSRVEKIEAYALGRRPAWAA